jgi:hypothetical protein
MIKRPDFFIRQIMDYIGGFGGDYSRVYDLVGQLNMMSGDNSKKESPLMERARVLIAQNKESDVTVCTVPDKK